MYGKSRFFGLFIRKPDADVCVRIIKHTNKENRYKLLIDK